MDINKEEETALVIVPDKQLSLAIGKDGQNARLSSRLTNWKVDIQGASDVQSQDVPNTTEDSSEIVSDNIELNQTKVTNEQTDDDKNDLEENINNQENLSKETEQSAQDELIALEKELEELEKQEKLEKDSKENEMLDVSSDELWQVDNSMFNTPKQEENTGIRFAEDISVFYETYEGRKFGK